MAGRVFFLLPIEISHQLLISRGYTLVIATILGRLGAEFECE